MSDFHCPPEPAHLPVKAGDPIFDATNRGDRFIPFWRARYDTLTGQSPSVPRVMLNGATSWVDGSVVYGPAKAWADSLRSFQGGKLKSSDENGKFPVSDQKETPKSPNIKALNTIGLPMKNPSPPRDHQLKDPTRLFIFGNRRANENPALLALQILWFREHNFQAGLIAQQNPTFNDHQIFFLARQKVIAEMQHILIDEWLPNWLAASLPLYTGWKSSSPPGVTHEFSIAFRWVESLLPSGLLRRDNACNFLPFTPPGDVPRKGARLCNLYWNSQDIFADGTDIDHIIMGMASQIAEAEDQFFAEDFRSFAYGPGLGFSRMDLMAVHIQRERDFGLPDFNLARINYGLAPFIAFNLTRNNVVNQAVQDLYANNISNVDIFVGGTMESQGAPGSLFREIILDVLTRIRDGDRFWYQNSLTGFFNASEIAAIQATTFKTILLRNTQIATNAIQDNPFLFKAGDPCPQPTQLAPQDMESCVPLLDFDYFSNSYIHIPVVVVALAVYLMLVVTILFILIIRRKGIESNEVNQIVSSMIDTVIMDGVPCYAAVETIHDDPITKRQSVYVSVSRETLHIRDSDYKFLRDIRMKEIEGVIIGGKSQPSMLIQVPKEYDALLEFADSVQRHTFFLALSKESRGTLTAETAPLRKMKRSMKTKQMRKKELKKFFRAAITAVVSRAELGTEQRFPPEVYEQQLSRDEFAESFSIAKNSLFVKQLFRMVDRDGKGYVAFREFLDFMGLFYNGTSDEKLAFLFDLYDTEKAGAISREALAKMLQSNMEIANVQHIEKDSVNKIVSLIWTELGLSPGEKIKFKDFKDFMGRNTVAQMAISLKQDYQPKTKSTMRENSSTHALAKAEPMDQYSTTAINHQLRGELTGRTPSRALTMLFTPESVKESFSHQLNNEYGEYEPTQTSLNNIITDRRIMNRKEKIISFITANSANIIILFLYFGASALLFAERGYTITLDKEHTGFRRYIGPLVTVTAKGAAQNLMFNYALLLVTMMRNIITKLRSGKVLGIPLHKYIPFDNIYFFHKMLANIAVFWALFHIGAHFINFFHISTQPPDLLNCLIRDYFTVSNELHSFAYWLFGTIPGFTGVILLFAIAVLHVFSTSFARRNVIDWRNDY